MYPLNYPWKEKIKSCIHIRKIREYDHGYIHTRVSTESPTRQCGGMGEEPTRHKQDTLISSRKPPMAQKKFGYDVGGFVGLVGKRRCGHQLPIIAIVLSLDYHV
jgi:hypothetical protein